MTHNFATIYDSYQDAIFCYCLWRCRDRELAGDLTQETFLRLWLCLRRRDEILNTRAFLYRIAYNLIVDHSRRKSTASLDALHEAGFELVTDPWQKTYSSLDAERVLRKVRQMPATYRQVLHRRFFCGLTPREIAMQTDENPNTISVRLYRALRHLRSLLVET